MWPGGGTSGGTSPVEGESLGAPNNLAINENPNLVLSELQAKHSDEINKALELCAGPF